MIDSLFLNYHAAIIAGFVLDLIVGDPSWLPHPVQLIGWLIAKTEKRIRKHCKTRKVLRRGAVVLLVTVSLITAALCGGILYGLSRLGQVWLFLGMVYFSYTALATSCLAREAKKVGAALTYGLDAGRKRLSYIVGRDTAALQEDEIVQAAVETVAENTTDGAVSVLFYLFLGGPVLAYFFKAVSTLDSMVGYRDETYRDIGWASARFDDILNYIPARISGILMAVAAYICKLDGKSAFAILWRDHANHLSPNCAWTEAAAAGALGLQLGGAHEYFGKTVAKPTIGDARKQADVTDIRRMNRLMYATVCLAFLLFCFAAGLIYYILIV